MALKKSQLYSSLWKSCDQLRGGMDASQYKDYVLTLLFMKYVSDKYAGERDPVIEVPAGGSFADMVACKGQKEIGEQINKIISRFAEANDLKGIIDQADFNDGERLGAGKAMQDRLTKLVAIFESLDFGANRASGDDLLGDAYEYLMRHFATESGKAKGQFYTPAEVSRVMAQVIGIGPDTRQDCTIYDPTCGSGSLLLKAADQASRGLTIYGQEMDNATWGLARMNMILHGHPTADLERGNTLADPAFKSGTSLKAFDFAVANPPFSAKSWSNGLDPLNDEFGRFEDGVPPDKNGDFAFLLHLVKSLKSRGSGAIILPHGALFRNREADIRRNLLGRGVIKGVIGLPVNLFYGTPIPACIVVVDKEDAGAHRSVFMMDASKGFRKDGAKNRLRAQDIHRIGHVFNQQEEIPGYSRMVPLAEIADSANDYNLNIPRYIDSTEPDDPHDLDAHLNGGIPDHDLDALAKYWRVFPSLRSSLYHPSDRPGYSDLRVAPPDVKRTLMESDDFASYKSQVAASVNGWWNAHRTTLRAISAATKPSILLVRLAEDLLAHFAAVPLLDCYDVYQILMDYWDDAMQDDVYLIASGGWVDAVQPRHPSPDTKEVPDLTANRQKWKMDLIPPALIAARFFAAEQAAVAVLQAEHDRAKREMEEVLEPHIRMGGALEDAADDKGKVTKKRLIALGDLVQDDDLKAQCLRLLTSRNKASRAANSAQNKLNAKVLGHYSSLTESTVKELVIEDKWFGELARRIDEAIDCMLAALLGRIALLEGRYSCPLPELEQTVAHRRQRVMSHLAQMGIVLDELDRAVPKDASGRPL